MDVEELLARFGKDMMMDSWKILARARYITRFKYQDYRDWPIRRIECTPLPNRTCQLHRTPDDPEIIACADRGDIRFGGARWIDYLKIIENYGNQIWYKNDKVHRDDGPAIICHDGCLEWCMDGKIYMPKMIKL